MVALDASKPLIDAATKMAEDGMLVVECPSTRGSSQAQEVTLDAESNPERVTFRQCDPMCLPAGLAGERSVLSFFVSCVSRYVWLPHLLCVGYDSFRLHGHCHITLGTNARTVEGTVEVEH